MVSLADRKKVFSPLGASNHSLEIRQKDDYYATPPVAVELLLKEETFSPLIWEPACGEGHISRTLEAHGYNVISTDLVYRGFGDPRPYDFMRVGTDIFNGDIITNPPYSSGLQFVKKAIECVCAGNKVAMLMKILFLEGQKRKIFYMEFPPKKVYVFSGRITCAKNGDFERYGKDGAQAYAWYVWEKGYHGPSVIEWIN